MIDFHTHVLPGIDDGSQNTGMSLDMLHEESRQGVDIVVATPHFYADRMSVEGFLENRAAAYEKLAEAARRAGASLPEIVPGAETYYFAGIGQAKAVPRLCIGQTRTLLLEMPFAQWTEEVLRDVRDLVMKQKLYVVLAHLERYVGFQKDRGIWKEVLDLPIHFQFNAGSFLRQDGFFRKDKKKRFCLEFMGGHPDMILGSDCHNMDSRRPNLGPGRAEIAARLGEEALSRLDAAAGEALSS